MRKSNIHPERATAHFYDNKKNPEIKLVLAIPAYLHIAAMEVAFREGRTLKFLIVATLEWLVSKVDTAGNRKDVTTYRNIFPETIGRGREIVRSSVFVSRELLRALNEISHYSRRTKGDIYAFAIDAYLSETYSHEYPDIFTYEHIK